MASDDLKIILFGDFRSKFPEKIRWSSELLDQLANSNIRVCNFEAPIACEGAKSIIKSGPVICQPITSARTVLSVGFNVVLLANNHVMDFREKGAMATLLAFKEVTTVGLGKSVDAYRVKIIEVKGKKIGFLSFVQYEFGVVDAPDNSGGFGAAWINAPEVCDIIRQARKKTDYLIVCPHAGVEHTDAPLPEWRATYKRFIDWGADIVVASHPHAPQGWESYKSKKIYYSLGNFYFDGLEDAEKIPYWKNGLGVEVIIDENGLSSNAFSTKFEKGFISLDNSIETKKHILDINELLVDDAKYEKYIDSMCRDKYSGYVYAFLRGISGTSLKVKPFYFFKLLFGMILGKKDETYILNTLRCESHRWVVENYLKRKNGYL